MRRHLLLFLRAPRLGAGKRRLARDIGDVAALRFERGMLALLRRRLDCDRRWRLRLVVTPDRTARRWHATGQGKGDLGRRMFRALASAPPGPVVLVGADIPGLTAAQIEAAFRRLGSRDLVFGPAADGGFWLVGARRRPLPRGLFNGVRWSSQEALADTLAGLPTRISVGFVDRLEDVDDAGSWRRLNPRRGF